MGKYTHLIEAKKQKHKPVFTETSKDVDADLPLVSLTIKVTKNVRLHWLISAKKEHKTLTEVIKDSLIKKYGLPKE